MPRYDFQHSETQEIHEVFFHMNDVKVYKGLNGDEEGKWVRLFHVPLAAIDTHLDPRNKNEFIRRTEKYKTIGETMDASRELSEKREAKDGIDPIKQKNFDDYAAARNGKKHVLDRPKKFENDRVSIDFT